MITNEKKINIAGIRLWIGPKIKTAQKNNKIHLINYKKKEEFPQIVVDCYKLHYVGKNIKKKKNKNTKRT